MKDTEKGFTLVELLVVISIIAMLLGILMPALNAARGHAKKVICKSNLHNCALAFRMYLDDNKDVMPVITNMPNGTAKTEDPPIPVYSAIGKYLGDQKVLQCPADRGTVTCSLFFDSAAAQATRDADCYYLQQGSSYEYNRRLNNQNIDKGFIARFLGKNEIYLLRDYSSFHGRPGKTGSIMYLFADTLVGDRERNK